MPEDQDTTIRLILPYLTIDAQRLPGQMTNFVDMLNAFVANPTTANPGDPASGLRIDNLRVAARQLKENMERIDELLARLETKKE